MSDIHRIFLLDTGSLGAFDRAAEVFSGVQFGYGVSGEKYLVVGGSVAVELAEGLDQDLDAFFAKTWGVYRAGNQNIFDHYNAWLTGIGARPHKHVTPVPVTRYELQCFVTTGSWPPPRAPFAPSPSVPPPPPTRPVTPRGGAPAGVPPAYGHLPFQAVTVATDVFYRCEPWPTSRRLLATGIEPDTFASPASEEDFLKTGFAAVARNALPSFFPAVFKYELQPIAGAPMLCGAIVPMFGMSGGGVEVMFLDNAPPSRAPTPTLVPIAPPAVLDPF